MSPAGRECWTGVLGCFLEICPVGFCLWIKGEGNSNAVVGQDLCAGQRGTMLGGGKAAGMPGAAQRCRGTACMGGCCARQEGWAPFRAGGVLCSAAPIGTAQAMVLSDAGRGGHPMGPGHRTAGGAAAGDRAALQHFAGRGDTQRRTGPGEEECGVAGTGAAPRRDEILGATHYRGQLLGWRCRLVRMAREEDAR